jgi:autotransporter-associated beta strand protein
VENGTTILGGVIVGQALDDLITASNALNAMPSPAANNLTGVNGGDLATQILAPGVYKFDVAASISLNGVLTLDAQGQNNVVWVINIGTSLTTGENAKVEFINLGSNGGADNGLFWNAGSAITLGATNVIAGNYLAGTDITFGTTVPGTGSGSGRALAQAGVTFDGPATMDVLGGPGNGDLAGGLTFDGGSLVSSGYVLLSAEGTYTQGASSVVLSPGKVYNTLGIVVDGGSADTNPLDPARLTVFQTIAELTGTNTYTGGTVIDGGQLTTGSQNLPTDGAVSLIDSNNSGTIGSIIFDQSIDGTFGGIISGGGSLTKENTAELTLTGANTYTGGTFVNEGTLIASAAVLPDAGDVTLATNTIVVFEELINASYAGNITGDGTLEKQGVGALALTGANTYTGGTFVNEGTLVASTASLPDAGDITLATDTIVVFDEASNSSYAGDIAGTGTLEKQGVGALALTNATTAMLDIQTGSLFINSGAGATTVAANGFLGGIGTINGNLINNGVVSPGFSPGTINVTGNYTQGPGGTLIMQFASDISYDQLIITGTASLDGTLQLDFLGGYIPVGQSFEIITADGGVTGTFDPITGSAAVAADVTYNPNNVTVDFVQVPFTVFAGTPNQNAVAAAAADSPAITTALNAIPDSNQMPAALNAISPQGYQIWSNIAFDHATSVTDRLARNRTNLPDRGNYYFEGGQRRGSVNGDHDVGSASYRSDFALVGGNFAVGPDFTLGGFLEYTKTNSDLGSVGSNSEIKKKLIGARAAWSANQWFAHAVIAYGREDYQSRRWIQFPGTLEMASSETTGHQWIANISAGRDFINGPITVTPFAGLLASHWKADGFEETGAGAFNATVGGQTADSLRTQLGVAAAADFNVNGVGIRPHARMAWMHELSDGQRTINAAFGATQFQTRTTKVKRDSLLLGVGLDLGLSPNATLYSHLSTRIGNNEDRLTREWLVGFSYSF